jgi:hypothetical protein
VRLQIEAQRQRQHSRQCEGKRAGGQGPAGQQAMGREVTAGGQGAVVAVAARGAMAAVAAARLNWGKE